MDKEAVIVLDCGATNIRAIAVDRENQILAARSFENHTSADPHLKGGLIWDTYDIIQKFSEASRFVCSSLGEHEIRGVCTTSFGVDGAPYDRNGKQLYPVISWACERTHGIMDETHSILPLQKLHGITGLNRFHFNTLYKLFWLNKYRRDILQDTHHWLFMPAIISGFLGAEPFTDVSMLGTSMLADKTNRMPSEEILSSFDLKAGWFPRLSEAGRQVGEVSREASKVTGIPEGTPVFAAGHDTQFAIYGSEAGVNEPVLSSGTWEILMVRTPSIAVGSGTLETGITTELDAVPGLLNPGMQWLGSKHIEKLKAEAFKDVMQRENVYEIMISEAMAGTARGLKFEELLVELAENARDSLLQLEKVCGFKAGSLIVVGGGSKNLLWNRIREETLGIPLRTIPQSETTVLGAAKIIYQNLPV